ncbi:MAG TPA: TonB-dependent receptor [Vicinamibacterales bacterium]|nr:TonB-dependent receptor [Vicinamibacterales bacterium]
MTLFCVRLIAAGFLLLVAAAAAGAQSTTTLVDLVGTVREESSKKALPDVALTIVNQETKVSWMTSSDENGRFVMPGLPVGQYRMTTSLTGYWPRTVENVTLTLGERVEVELVLIPSIITDHVDVVSEAEAVLSERSPGSDVITQDRIDALPINGRDVLDFAALTPGVSFDETPLQGPARTSGLSMSGQRGRSNNIQVDGLDNNDETVGSVRALFSQDSVREFQVISGSPSAEFGAASGGIVNVVTRSGTDVVSGSLFGFFRDDALNSKAYFEKFTPAGDAIDMSKAPYNQWQYGATVGGPVKRINSFYFLSFERADVRPSNLVTIDDQTTVFNPFTGQQLGTPAQVIRNAGFPVETGSVPYETVLNQFLGKLDRHSDNQSFGARLNTATELYENIEPFGGQIARSRGAVLESTDIMGAGYHTAVLSPRTLNELRGQVAFRDQIARSLDPSCGLCTDENAGGPTLEVTGYANVGRQRFTPTYRDNTRYQVTDSLSHYRGNHQWRAGIDVSYIDGRRQSLPLHFGGRYIFQEFNLPTAGGPVRISSIQAVALGLPVAYVQGYGFSGAASDFGQLGSFVQDTWRAGSSLTLSLGLRYQTQFWPASTLAPAGYPGSYQFQSDRNDLAPRVAVTWRPGNSRTTTVQGGYGVYYDNTLTSVFGITKYINGGSDGVRTLVLRGQPSFGAWARPGHHLSEAEALQITNGSFPSVAITIDPDLTTPYAHHTTIGVERQLPGQFQVSAHFIHVRGFGQLGTIDYNPLVQSLGVDRRPADVDGRAGTSASVLQYTSFGETWYRGLRLSVSKRLPSGQVIVNYTLSKAEDNSSDFQTAFLPENNGRGRNPDDPDGLPLDFRPDDERGPSLQDERHRLVATGVFAVPGGIQLATIVAIGSGHPYNIVAGSDLNRDGDGGSSSPDRPRTDPNDPATSIGRNAGRLPSFATVDFRVARPFRVMRKLSVQPMLEVFNLFNRTNFTGVQNVFGTGVYPSNPSPTFGQFTQAAAPRQVQLALKVDF